MKKLFKPACLLFYILTILCFFILGLFFAGWIEAGKNQGLAGGAIVLSYGILFAGISLIVSVFVAYYVKHKVIVVGNIILALLLLVSLGYFRYRYKQKQEERQIQQLELEQPKQPTAPADNGKLLALNARLKPRPAPMQKTIGLGFFAPNFYDNPVFHFYGNPNHEKSIQEHHPFDSIVFQKRELGGFDISMAPPWLAPDHMKLDYDVLYFKIKSLGRDFVQVVVNDHTGQTAYVDRYQGKVIVWPEFLLGVHSVEFLPESDQKVKVKPFEAASEVITSYSFMRPIMVQHNWIQVELWNDGFKKVGEGYVQWRKDGKLLVTYNLLS